jgi:hydroxymethylglutaryl-CoA reductase
MNICHGLLNAIGVSTPELERMIALARCHGAAGAKLTGAGGGGAMVAMCPGNIDAVRDALEKAGYRTLRLSEFAN